MRDFTQEEKELIVNTPITMDCFEMRDFAEVEIDCISQYVETNYDWWFYIINACEYLRQRYNETKYDRYFIELVRLLPNTYNVVKL